MQRPRLTRRRAITLSLAALACTLFYVAWPWLRPLPQRFGPLANYRVFEPSVQLDAAPQPTPGGWREPHSRWELLTTLDHDVLYAKKNINSVRRQQKRQPITPRLPPPTPVGNDDRLTDFVIDHGDSFGYPASHKELDEAIAQGKARRASEFFGWRYHYGEKPFYGRLPTSLCYSDTGPDRGNFRANYFSTYKEFQEVTAGLETPKEPTVFIVTAGGISNAQRAVYDRKPPVTYPGEIVWAAVYAGSSHSEPRAYLLDRVTITPSNTEVILHKPRPGGATADHYPYWFFIPLGPIPAGKYTVNVRLIDNNSLLATTTADLRAATEEELAARNAELENLQRAATEHGEKRRQLELEHGAALQLHLERLAEFVHTANVSDQLRDLLRHDVERLGEAVDWSQDIYGTRRYNKQPLAPPTPGQSPDDNGLPAAFDMNRPAWSPSEIALRDIWLCDITDADWFADKTYRDVPEFADAFTTTEPTELQQKIRAICEAIAAKGGPKHGAELFSHAAAGTLHDALQTAYAVQVDNQPPPRDFAKGDEMWAVLVARRSFLIRKIDSRFIVDSFNNTKRREFRISASAYIAPADGAANDATSPVTFAIVPLGKQDDVDSVGIHLVCDSISCRGLRGDAPHLLETNLPDPRIHNFSRFLASPTGFRITGD